MTSKYDDHDGRLRGRKLQARRLKMWTKSPCCAKCKRLTNYPDGFELDHKVALFRGGEDKEDNLQVLCNGPDGCHAKKTAEDMGHRVLTRIGIDGFPE